MKKYKWLILNFISIFVVIVSLILGVLTKDEPYTVVFAIPIIVCLFLAAFFLFKFHEAHYSKNTFNHKKKIMKEKAKKYKSIFIKPNDLYYYLNRKLIGGEEVLIKYNDTLYFIGRQVYIKYVEPKKSKAESFYSIDRHRYDTYSELVDNLAKKGIHINELEFIEIIALEGREPELIDKKRDFSKQKEHKFLSLFSIIGISLGFIILCVNFGLSDAIEKKVCLILGLTLLLTGVVFSIVLINKIKDETII